MKTFYSDRIKTLWIVTPNALKSGEIKYKNTSFEIYNKIVFKFLLRHPRAFAALLYVYHSNPNSGLVAATLSTYVPSYSDYKDYKLRIT
jgi:hypothetical protein